MNYKWTLLTEKLPPPGVEVWVWRQWIPEGEDLAIKEIVLGTRNNAPLIINEDWTKDMHWGSFADVTVHAWQHRRPAKVPKPRYPKK